MFRLADETTLERVEGGLRRAREFRDALFSWWWNVVALVFIAGSFLFFLYARVTSPVVEEKRIPFEPQVWYSAARGVRSEDYETQRSPLQAGGLHGPDSEFGAPV